MANVSKRDKALELVYGLMYDQFAMVPAHTNMKNFTEGKNHALIGGHYTVNVEKETGYKKQLLVSIKVHTHTQEFINFCHEHGFSNDYSTCLFLHYYSDTEWTFRYMSDEVNDETGYHESIVITELNR